MSTIEIKLINSKWLVNGKQYHELCGTEKQFFDEFIIIMKLNFKKQ